MKMNTFPTYRDAAVLGVGAFIGALMQSYGVGEAIGQAILYFLFGV